MGFSTTALYRIKHKILRMSTNYLSRLTSAEIGEKPANYGTFCEIFYAAKVDNSVDNLWKSLPGVGEVTFKWLDG